MKIEKTNEGLDPKALSGLDKAPEAGASADLRASTAHPMPSTANSQLFALAASSLPTAVRDQLGQRLVLAMLMWEQSAPGFWPDLRIELEALPPAERHAIFFESKAIKKDEAVVLALATTTSSEPLLRWLLEWLGAQEKPFAENGAKNLWIDRQFPLASGEDMVNVWGETTTLPKPRQFRNLLMRAAEIGRADLVQTLLGFGACPDARDEHSQTALMMAIKDGQLDCAQALTGVSDQSATDLGGNSAAYLAAIENDDRIVALFANKEDQARRAPGGWTPLMASAHLGSLKAVEIQEPFADLLAVDEGQRTALDIACHISMGECVEFLARKMHERHGEKLAELVPNWTWSAMCEFLRTGRDAVEEHLLNGCQTFVELGADLTHSEPNHLLLERSRNVFSCAVEGEAHASVVEWMLDEGLRRAPEKTRALTGRALRDLLAEDFLQEGMLELFLSRVEFSLEQLQSAVSRENLPESAPKTIPPAIAELIAQKEAIALKASMSAHEQQKSESETKTTAHAKKPSPRL